MKGNSGHQCEEVPSVPRRMHPFPLRQEVHRHTFSVFPVRFPSLEMGSGPPVPVLPAREPDGHHLLRLTQNALQRLAGPEPGCGRTASLPTDGLSCRRELRNPLIFFSP